MARKLICGWEAGDSSEAQTTGGTFSVQTAVKRSGDYALRVNPTTTNTGWQGWTWRGTNGLFSSSAITDLYARFYFRVATLPASASEEICQFRTNLGTQKLAVRVTSAGKLQAWDTANTQIGGDGATTLATGVWYRLEVLCGTGSSASFEVRIDGATELSGTADLATAGTTFLRVGKVNNRNGQTVDFYYDDLAADDAAWPGAGAIARMDPDGDGAYTGWTGTYADLDDISPGVQDGHDGDTTYVATASTTNETVTLESCAAAGVSGTILAAMPLAITRDEGGGTAVQLRVRVGGADTDSASANISSSYASQGVIYETNPTSGVAWTTSDLDGTEIGLDNASAVAARCTLICMMVEYNPVVSGIGRLVGEGRLVGGVLANGGLVNP